MLSNRCRCSRATIRLTASARPINRVRLLRQILVSPRRRGRQCCGCRRLFDTDRGDKAITLTRRRRDVPPAGASIAQRPPQGADLEFEVPLLDKGAPPHAGDQFVFADQLPRALH